MLEVEPAGRQASNTSSVEVGERESLAAATAAAAAAAAAAALCRWCRLPSSGYFWGFFQE